MSETTLKPNAAMTIDGDELTYREDGVLRLRITANPDDTMVCMGQNYPLIVIPELLRQLADALRLRDEHKASAEVGASFFHTVGTALAPPDTTSFTGEDVLKWVAFAKVGLEIANTGLGDYRRRAEAAEEREAKLREGIEFLAKSPVLLYSDKVSAAGVLAELNRLLAPAPEVTDGK